MTSQVFIDMDQGSVITASWLNPVNNFIYRKTVIVATAGQTVFSCPTYVQDGHIEVSINGLIQQLTAAYTETSTTSITFTSGLSVGDIVVIRG